MANSISNLARYQRSEFPLSKTGRKAIEDKPSAPSRSKGPDFSDAFADAIERASSEEQTATQMATDFADGDPNVGIHEVVIASERANISMRYAVTLKNKLVEAYKEIMNTQV